VKAALGAENIANVDLPRQLYEAVNQKSVVKSQVRRSLIKIWSVIENACLGDRVAVTSHECAVGIRLAGNRIRDLGRHSNEAVSGTIGDREGRPEACLQITG
jgi:hypothetical protein